MFTAVDMFSKYLWVMPIKNSDALTVGLALYYMVTTFGVCNTLVSDNGSEFIAKAAKETCRLLQVQQNFTPSFVHKCLGACERTHRVLAEKLTPYMNRAKNNWESLLPSIIFAMNAAVNRMSGYSPFEVVFGQRPTFPLAGVPVDMSTIPASISTYVEDLQRRLEVVRSHMKDAVLLNQDKMVAQQLGNNKETVQTGDYVYLQQTPTGAGHKLQNIYSDVLVVKEKLSEHLATLSDPTTGKVGTRPVHLDRLKPAHIRAPTPSNYFRIVSNNRVECGVQTEDFSPITSSSSNRESASDLQSDINEHFPQINGSDSSSPISSNLDSSSDLHSDVNVSSPQVVGNDSSRSMSLNQESTSDSHSDIHAPSPQVIERDSSSSTPLPVLPQRPKRTIKKPVRYRDSSFTADSDMSSSTGQDKFYKIKRVLAQRGSGATLEYLIQFRGEPSQNAMWLKPRDLNTHARKTCLLKPPKTVL